MEFVLSFFSQMTDNRGRKRPGLISFRVKAEIPFDLRDLELLLSYFLTPSRTEIDLYTPGALEALYELRCIQIRDALFIIIILCNNEVRK